MYRFKLASLVPVGSTISFRDLAEKSGLREQDVKRIVRYTAVYHRLFHEPKKGIVAHTAASKLLAENPVADHLMGLAFDECWPAHNRVSSIFFNEFPNALYVTHDIYAGRRCYSTGK